MHEISLTAALGRSIVRSEDARLLQGRGRFTDDIRLSGEACAVFVRSPHAHADLLSVDTGAALAMPGVLAVFTGADVAADGLGPIRCFFKRMRPPGDPEIVEPDRPILAQGRVRHVGEAVALAVAETAQQARDAAEAVAIAYRPLAAAADIATASAPDAPRLHVEAPGNRCFIYRLGDSEATARAFAGAAHVTRLDLVINRISANPMEPRGAIGQYESDAERATLYSGTQSPHLLRHELAHDILRLPENAVRVVSPDVGGGFGMKHCVFPEEAAVLWAARRLGRPVRWISDRSEAFLADNHARENLTAAELALDGEGRFLGVRVRTRANMGAYLAAYGPHSPITHLGSLAGVYTTPCFDIEVEGYFSNSAPVAPFRGAGRPEACYTMERLIDAAAAELDMDPAELRRRNCIRSDQLPYRTGLTFTYDSGTFAENMTAALEAADWQGFPARRAAAHARGRLRGIGLANAIAAAGGGFEETAEIRFDPGGTATLLMGTAAQGQGHETAFRQLAADLLGLPEDRFRLRQGDTAEVYHGQGTFGSRSLSVGGAALSQAAARIVAKGRTIAAHLMETAAADIEFARGRFTVAGTDRGVGLEAVARAAFDLKRLPRGTEPGLAALAVFVPDAPTFPNGCHVCEVEIDPDTGVVDVVRYSLVEDVGRMVNPLLVHGQVHGGVAQGLGQILREDIRYEPGTGQLITGSFMDYAMPRAADSPAPEVRMVEVPAASNPLGIKGAGEAGTVAALPAAMNAVLDALRPIGVRNLDMPATSERVWRAIRAAQPPERRP